MPVREVVICFNLLSTPTFDLSGVDCTVKGPVYIMDLYIVVTQYITAADQLPKIFNNWLIFSAKLTCI